MSNDSIHTNRHNNNNNDDMLLVATLLFIVTGVISWTTIQLQPQKQRPRNTPNKSKDNYHRNDDNNDNTDGPSISHNCYKEVQLLNKFNRMTKEEILCLRKKYFSKTLSISYNNTSPLMIVKGRGCYLYDKVDDNHDNHDDNDDNDDDDINNKKNSNRPYHHSRYLDTRNNVAHVGHCHPRVIQIVQEQMTHINTNTRYLHPIMTLLAQQLLQTFPKPPSPASPRDPNTTNISTSNNNATSREQELTKVFFCNSGSEANDLALRLTRAYLMIQQQRRRQQQLCTTQPWPKKNNTISLIVVDHAYHGHTIATLDVSPYKYTHSSEFISPKTTGRTVDTTREDHLNHPNSDIQRGMHELPSLLCRPQQLPSLRSVHTLPVHDDAPQSSDRNWYARPTFHVQSVPCPNTYRGLYRTDSTRTTGSGGDSSRKCHVGKLYAQHVEEIAKGTDCIGTTLMIESGMSVGGVVIPPKNYIYHAVQAVRSVGGLYIADEIQTGLGRYGTDCYWGFQYNKNGQDDDDDDDNEPSYLNPIPDIVTVGKGFGNGMPIAAVICNDKVNDAFEELLGNVEVFNTFGGNPVCASAALMVLRIIEQEQLQKNATIVGTYLIQQLTTLQQQPASYIGDVRGCGLFIGIEFVLDPTARVPATKLVSWLCSTMKDSYRIITSIDGPDNNVLVIKPPMVFSIRDADDFISSLQSVLLIDLPKYIVRINDTTMLQACDGNQSLDHTPT